MLLWRAAPRFWPQQPSASGSLSQTAFTRIALACPVKCNAVCTLRCTSALCSGAHNVGFTWCSASIDWIMAVEASLTFSTFLCALMHIGASQRCIACSGSKLNNGHLCIWVRGGCGLGICPPDTSSGHKGGINNYTGWFTWEGRAGG